MGKGDQQEGLDPFLSTAPTARSVREMLMPPLERGRLRKHGLSPGGRHLVYRELPRRWTPREEVPQGSFGGCSLPSCVLPFSLAALYFNLAFCPLVIFLFSLLSRWLCFFWLVFLVFHLFSLRPPFLVFNCFLSTSTPLGDFSSHPEITGERTILLPSWRVFMYLVLDVCKAVCRKVYNTEILLSAECSAHTWYRGMAPVLMI